VHATALDAGPTRYGVVRDWMTHRLVTVTEDCPIGVALVKMRTAEIRHVAVVDRDRLTGIVSTRDVRRLLDDPAHAPGLAEPVRRIMSEDPITVAAETPVATAVRLLLEHRIGALPVQEGTMLVGIFTTSDALEALLAITEAVTRCAAPR